MQNGRSRADPKTAERQAQLFSLLGKDPIPDVPADEWALVLECFDYMLKALAKDYPEVGPQLAEPTTGGPAEVLPVPAPPAVSQRNANNRPPQRRPERQKWVAAWAIIYPEWRNGKTSYKDLAAWLAQQNPDLNLSEDIIGNVVRAGLAGKLDIAATPPNSP